MKNKILKKSVAFLLLVSMNMNIFAANLVLDPNSQHNTKLDTSANGTPIINISTPNNRGVSINEFLEYNVGHEGQVLNNADNLGRSHLAGLINANPNLGPNQAANLILLQVNGANRSQIEGYIEALSRDKVNVILSNENGIYLNGAGTINIRNFIPTTGRVKLKDGDVVGIDVEKGRVVIGANGFDATNTDYVNVIAKALEMQGNLVGNKVDVTLGENFVDNSGAVTSKGGINSVAIDASNLGSMYAGQVRIISTDKGAGVNSRALIYSKDEKLEITADGKINVAKIKGNGIEIKGSDYSQSEIASSDKDINITANTVKLAGQTQANGNISLNADVENDSEIFANGNLKTKDLTNSGKIQVSKTTQISGKLNNSGSVASVNKVTVTKDVKNTGEISTNDDFTAKNIVSSGKVSGKNIQVDNVSNNGKIIAASNFKAKKVKNTKEIAAVGKISTDDLETSGDVRSNGKITVNGNLENSGNVETGSDIAVSKDIKNSGKVLANGNLSGKNTENSGEVQAENISTDNVKNSGKINTKDFKSKNVTNTGKVLASGKISADDVDNGGKILTNGRLTAKNVKNSGKIASGDKISSKRLENSGTVATNSDISATDSLVNHNGGNIEGKNVEVKGFELRNAGKISAGNVKAKVNESTNSGQIHSSRDVDLDTQKLTNTGEILAVNDVNSANADVINNGKIASNNKILLDNSKITNTGEILSGDISMQNAQKFDNTGTIKANNTVLTTTQDINLDGNLHGQQRLIISGRNITNNGNTTGTGLIQITSNDFTNNRDISSDTVIINGQGNIVNNAMITGDNGKISGNDITNNDLIAFEKYLEINAQNKVQNNKDKTIYGGQTLIIKGNDILNDEGEILGGNMDLNAGKIVNNVGTIQATGDILITSSDFQNVGRVSNLDKYEKYYETWDGIKLSENEVNNGWIYKIGKQMSKGKHSNDVLIPQRNWLEKLKNSNLINGYKSYLFTNHYDLIEEKIGQEGNHNDMKTGTVKFPQIALEGKMKSNATTEYGKVLANGNITINSGNVKNKDSIISGGGIVNINASSLENSVTLGNAVQLSNGREEVYVAFHRGHNKVSADTFFKRTLTDEKGNLLKGKIGYEAGQPSIIEGSVVNINAPVITSPITEANGKINNGSVTHGVAGSLFTNAIGKGISSTNGAVNVNLANPNIQIVNNMSSVQAILNTGTISVNPLLTSAMFTQNMNPSSKYLLETRSKYVDLNKYYGSDYFLSRLGYTPSWNRVRRLGDAYYENQLITRALTEQLGTAFINGKSNEDLIKSLMDNAGMESSRLGLQVGKELTPEQISGLSKDLIWYVTQNVNGVEVLVPKIYLSKDTLATITADGRNKIGGVNGTYIKTDNFVNNGMKIGNGGVTYVQANTIKNETATNLLSEITGDKTFIHSVGNIENIGGKISGNEAVVLISDNGKVINDTTKRSVGYYNSEFDRTKHEEVKSLGTISSNGTVFVKANSYESTGGMLSADHLALDVNKVNLNALSLSGEDKFGSGGSNFSRYAETTHLGAGVSANSASGTVGDMNLKGSSFIAKDTTGLTVTGNIKVESAVNSYENESKSTSKGFMSSKSSYKNSHAEENSASNLMLGENAVILGDINSIGSNVVLGDNTYIGGKLTTDAQQLHNSYFEENKKKGFSGGISHGTASLSYGKSQNSYDEKSTINAGSNLQIGDGSVLNKGAEIIATNFEYGNIQINNGDVKYGARIDTRDVHTESKSSSFGISAGINSPILDRAKQAGNAVKQVKDGDTAGGAMEVINAVTGTIKGLADNQGTRQTNYDVNGSVGKQGVQSASANNNFYANIGVNAGISKSKSSSDSHTESAVITTMKPTDGNSSITYNNVKNIEYQGTQAQGGTFVYNNVENIRKEAVELHNSSNSSSSSKGISASATVGYGHKMQTTGNGGSISASKSNQNTEETMYQNGNFANVNEVHNNTGSMIISGFNQDGGKLTGNIGKVEVTSKQNTSTTTGSSKGMSIGVSSQGIPTSVNVNASKTNGNRNFVDNQSSFTVGEGSNLQVGTLENTGAIIGKQSENATFKIDNYVGKNLQNDDEMKTTGGAIGVSTGKPKVTSLEFSQDSRDKEGVTRNTVVGNVEIGQASGDEINRDLSKANEVTKDSRSSTNVSVESQTIEYATDSGKLKEDLGKAKDEIEAIGAVTKATIATIGSKEQNSFLDFLKTERLQETIRNIGYIDTKNKTKDEIVKEMKDKYGEIFKQNGKELEVNFYVNSEVSSDDPRGEDKRNSAGFLAEDGSIWLNADNISSINNFNLNSVFTHEGTHKVTGKNTELLANYGEARASGFIEKAIDKGYLARTGGGLNWNSETLTKEQKDRLASYKDIEEKLKVGNYVDNNVKNKLNNEINKKYGLKNFYISNDIQSLDNNGKSELAKEIVNEFVKIFGDEIFNYSQAQGQNKKKIGDEIIKKYGISEEKLKSLENSDSYKWNGEGEKIVGNVILKNINIENNLNSILNNKNLTDSQKASEINMRYGINITIDDLKKPSELTKNIEENSSIQNIVEQDNVKLANSARWESKFFKDFYANTQKLTNRPLVIDEDDFVWYVGDKGYLSPNSTSGNVSFVSERYMNSNENENAKIFDGYEKDGFFTKRADEKITDDTVVWGNDKNKYHYGNILVETIIDDDEVITVIPGKSPSFSPKTNNLFMDYNYKAEYLVKDSNFQGKLEKIKAHKEILPNYITYAHELVHSYHALKGTLDYDMKHYFFLDSNNKKHISGEGKLENFEIYNHDENRYYTAEEMYQNLMNNNDYLTGINDPENSIKYDTLGTYNEMKDNNSEVYKFFIETAKQKLDEAKKNNSKKNVNINVPFLKIPQEEFNAVGNKMGKRNNEPTQNNIDSEHRGNEHNRSSYSGGIEW